jgi:hypothetical protein
VIRFRIGDLIDEWNGRHPDEPPLHMQLVADAIGVSRSTLAGLTTLTREPVTNTAVVECLARFFRQRFPDFEVGSLFEFSPPLGQRASVNIRTLYPHRAAKAEEYRQRQRDE